jgi:hypothetical protein
LISTSHSAWADVYKYTAPDGHVYYTDQPQHKKYKLIIRSKPKGYKASFKHLQKNKKEYTPIIEAELMCWIFINKFNLQGNTFFLRQKVVN